jgi:hypothetical protein
MSARRGRSASVWRMVRGLAVRRVFFVFLLSFIFDPLCFRVLVVRGFGRSACAGRTVRWCLTDSPRAPRRRSVFRGSLLEVLLALTDSPRFRAGRSACAGRTVRWCLADSPRAPRGRSVFRGSLLEVLLALTDSPRFRAGRSAVWVGQSAAAGWTVRVARADNPPLLGGQSARAWLLCFLIRFLSPSFVLPRVLQGIVSKT